MLLLSLVGEQPIPNLLPLWQFKEYTATQLVATRTTMPVATSLRGAIQADPQLKHVAVLDTLIVEAYNIGQARGVLATALNSHLNQGREARLNLTGGTKLMSLAALQAAFGSGVRLIYVSSEENCTILLGSDGVEIERLPIQVKITVEQYLAAHGLEVGDDHSFKPDRRRYSTPPPKQGDALEMEVERLARQSGSFDDVRRGVFVRRITERGPVINELDVVVTRNGKLAVCSCKTGKRVTKETIYELSSISRREAAGIYCGKLLATDQETLLPALRDRARSMGVRLVYGKELPKIAEHLLLAVGEKPA
jgi:hypothetical protein